MKDAFLRSRRDVRSTLRKFTAIWRLTRQDAARRRELAMLEQALPSSERTISSGYPIAKEMNR